MIGTPEFGALPEAPARGYSSTKHLEAAAALRAAPGEWAKVGSYKSDKTASAAAYRLKTGKVKSFQPDASGTYEAVARGADLWARYIPIGTAASA